MHAFSPALPIILTLAAGFLGGCRHGSQSASKDGSEPATAEFGVMLDGDTREWPTDSVAWADQDYIYLRFTVENERFTLQAAPQTVAILLDADGNAATGMSGTQSPTSGLGIDLEIQCSPLDPNGGAPTKGAACFAVSSDGTRTPIANAALDVSFAPTYAAEWYEMRIKRDAPLAALVASAGGGLARGVVVMTDHAGEIEAWADPFSVSLPPARKAGDSPAAGDVGQGVIPARPAESLRVMTLNVLKSGPVTRPDSFARLLNAVAPDVVLLEEWDDGDATSVQAWFTTLIKSDAGWHVLKPAGSSVAIASRYPITQIGGKVEGVTKDDGTPHGVRYVAGTVNSPIGAVAVAAVHLKCCGSADSWEDQLRTRESKAINANFAAAAKDVKVRLIGGDFNLVGSRPPLDIMRSGLDADASDLSIADPIVSGDHAMYTWVDWNTAFTPGRLDYLLYSDSSAEVVRSFVIDTSRLSDAALNAAGLSRSDSQATDHRPVVVDVRAKR